MDKNAIQKKQLQPTGYNPCILVSSALYSAKVYHNDTLTKNTVSEIIKNKTVIIETINK